MNQSGAPIDDCHWLVILAKEIREDAFPKLTDNASAESVTNLAISFNFTKGSRLAGPETPIAAMTDPDESNIGAAKP